MFLLKSKKNNSRPRRLQWQFSFLPNYLPSISGAYMSVKKMMTCVDLLPLLINVNWSLMFIFHYKVHKACRQGTIRERRVPPRCPSKCCSPSCALPNPYPASALSHWQALNRKQSIPSSLLYQSFSLSSWLRPILLLKSSTKYKQNQEEGAF